ncbi:MAG: hypothetical protein ACK587_10815 [Cyanobacteriota bacterium]
MDNTEACDALCSAALGVAICQAGYATGEIHVWALLEWLLDELDLHRMLFQSDALPTQKCFSAAQGGGAGFLLSIKPNQRTLHRQIQCQFKGKRQIHYRAMDHKTSPDHAPLSDQTLCKCISIASICDRPLAH